MLFGSGPLSPSIGDLLSQVTDVCQMYGSAENGQIQLLVPQKGEWDYMEWNSFEEVDMQRSTGEAFELVLHQDLKFSKRRSLHHNLADITERRTGDLFLPHPSKAGLWRFYARVDDLILLSNSHKINPVAMESIVLGNQLLSGALVVGTGRPQPALILELKSSLSVDGREITMEHIWPTIQQVNRMSPEYAQISPSKVVFSVPSRPFFRALKGTVIRRSTVEAYATEIESLYSDCAMIARGLVLNDISLGGITYFVREAIGSLVGAVIAKNNEDFFDHGIDSLKVTELLQILKYGLRNQKNINLSALSTKSIYQHPTISHLALFLHTTIYPSWDFTFGPQYQMQIENMVKEHTQSLPSLKHEIKKEVLKDLHVLLTGLTGSLGSKILETLLQSSQISKIYCLNRSIDAIKKQGSMFVSEENARDPISQKTKFLHIDFTKARMALSETTYLPLLAKVDVILHVAWTLDFNLSFQSYETHHIHGVRSLIDFSITSDRHPRIIFTSFTSFAVDWASAHGTNIIPEEILTSSCEVSSTGYGQSKQVAELILPTASKTCNMPTTILRLGQVVPSRSVDREEMWSKSEWIPALLKTSRSMNLIPVADFSVDWMSIEEVAQMIKDIMLQHNTGDYESRDELCLRIYNLVNPRVR